MYICIYLWVYIVFFPRRPNMKFCPIIAMAEDNRVYDIYIYLLLTMVVWFGPGRGNDDCDSHGVKTKRLKYPVKWGKHAETVVMQLYLVHLTYERHKIVRLL